jgi:hypothetical protein
MTCRLSVSVRQTFDDDSVATDGHSPLQSTVRAPELPRQEQSPVTSKGKRGQYPFGQRQAQSVAPEQPAGSGSQPYSAVWVDVLGSWIAQ